MEFIIENQMWFIVGAIVLLMAFIGFIAEKTDFGRKEFEKKIKVVKEPKQKKSKKEPKETKEEIIEDVDQIVDNTELEQEEVILDDEPVVLDEEIEEEIKLEEEPTEDTSWGTEDLSMVEAKSDFVVEPELTEITGDVLEPSNVEEDLYEPLTTNIVEEPVIEEVTEQLNDDIFAPLTEVEEEAEETVIAEDLTVPFSIEEQPYKIENEDELPSIDSLGEEESEDDVWKF